MCAYVQCSMFNKPTFKYGSSDIKCSMGIFGFIIMF